MVILKLGSLQLPILKIITGKWPICQQLSPLSIWGPVAQRGKAAIELALWVVQVEYEMDWGSRAAPPSTCAGWAGAAEAGAGI